MSKKDAAAYRSAMRRRLSCLIRMAAKRERLSVHELRALRVAHDGVKRRFYVSPDDPANPKSQQWLVSNRNPS